MRINIIISGDDRIRQKVKYGLTLLFLPMKVELEFSKTFTPDCPNIFYGRQLPNDSKPILWIRSSDEFIRCVSGATLPDLNGVSWFEYNGKRIPKLFPSMNPINPGIDFDIAAATFILASDFQDLVSLERDEYDRLRAMDSIQYKLGVLNYPVVNYYSFFLKETLEEYFGIHIDLKTYAGATCGIALTHDVDYTTYLSLKMIRREAFGIAVLNRHQLGATQRAEKLLFPLYALLGRDFPKIGLRLLRDTESRNGLRSTFFIKAGASAKQDVGYDYKSPAMKEFFKSLVSAGFEIGLHPSMKTYVDPEQFILERNRLQDATGNKIETVRQHYLRFTAGKTVRIWEEAAMKYDSTLGFSREAGFRNSLAFPYPLYDFAGDRVSGVIELPLIIMDGTFAENKTISNSQALERMKELLAETKTACGAAAILFHNSYTDPIDFPGYTGIYEELLREIKESGFLAGTLSAVIENFR